MRVFFTWENACSGMYNGKKAGQWMCVQCSAGKPWVLHTCECYFDMYHLSNDRCRPHRSLHGNNVCSLMAVDNAPATLLKLYRNVLRNMTELKLFLWPPYFPDLNSIEHLEVLDP